MTQNEKGWFVFIILINKARFSTTEYDDHNNNKK